MGDKFIVGVPCSKFKGKCKYCQKTFTKTPKLRKYCCYKCRMLRRRDYTRNWRKKKPKYDENYENENKENNKKAMKTENLLGCTVEKLKQWLEYQFKPGMSWDNRGYYGWHIDHIRPCCSFDLSKPEEQKKCFNYTNLQPLWRKDNQSKGAKYVT